jgi:hypothetical protein
MLDIGITKSREVGGGFFTAGDVTQLARQYRRIW